MSKLSRRSMLHATAVVIATGARTYFGSLAKAIVGKRAPTSFERGVNSVTWVLIRFMLIMVPVVFVINGFTKGEGGRWETPMGPNLAVLKPSEWAVQGHRDSYRVSSPSTSSTQQ